MSGSASSEYVAFTIHTLRNGRNPVMTANLRLSAGGDFYYKFKVPNFNRLFAWNCNVCDIKNHDSTVFIANYNVWFSCEQTISGNDSYFEIKGRGYVSEFVQVGISAFSF